MGYELKITYPKLDPIDLKGISLMWNRDALLYKDVVLQTFPNIRTCFKNIEGKHPTHNNIKYLILPSKEVYHYVPDINEFNWREETAKWVDTYKEYMFNKIDQILKQCHTMPNTKPILEVCSQTWSWVVTMSYRLVAKRTPPTLRVQTNNLS